MGSERQAGVNDQSPELPEGTPTIAPAAVETDLPPSAQP
jgi:hypothetical protein